MKKKVHFADLKYMQKYIEGFNPDDYEGYFGNTDPSVIEYVRNYYDKHLPVDVTAWIRVNNVPDNSAYNEVLKSQVRFVRDRLCELLMSTYEEWKDNEPLVISTHSFRGVRLPVFQITLEKYGVEMVLRNTFCYWKVSVKSKKPLDLDFMGLFNPSENISYFSCDGFPKNKVYGCYDQNHSQFTIELHYDYDLYVFAFLLKNYLGIKKK